MQCNGSERLSDAQRDMLRSFDGYGYGQGHVKPLGRRTADVLVRKGLLRDIGQGWCEITERGRHAAWAPADPLPGELKP